MPASNVPGYILGYRLNAANYSGGEIAEQSGYGEPIKDLHGTPTFEVKEGHEGVLLDNTWHGTFWHPNSWSGTMVAVMRSEVLTGGTLVRYPIVFTNDGTSGGNGRFGITHFSGNHRLKTTTTAGKSSGDATISASTITAVALAHDQEARTHHATIDGVTVTSSAPDADAVHGLNCAMGTTEKGAIIGALQGDSANTTAEVDLLIHMFELHFFEGNPIINSPTEMQAFLAELAAAYS